MEIKLDYENACVRDIELDLIWGAGNKFLVPIYIVYLDDGKGGYSLVEYGKRIDVVHGIDWQAVQESYNEYFRSLYKVKGMKMARKDSGLVMLSTYKQWVLEYEKERK